MTRLLAVFLALALVALAFTGWRQSEAKGDRRDAQRIIGTLQPE